MKPRIFISAVTAEFRETRELIAKVLLRMGYEPVWQDIFGTNQGDLRQMLRKKIDDCDGLIHVVGSAYGFPSPQIMPEFGLASYTQFELLYARERLKKAWVLIAEDGYPAEKTLDKLDLPVDPSEPDPHGCQKERQRLQCEWRKRLLADSNVWYTFGTREALELRLEGIKDDLARLRKSFLRWQRTVSVLLTVMCLGVGWLVYQQLRAATEAVYKQDARAQEMQIDDDFSLDPGATAHKLFSSTIQSGNLQLRFGKVADATAGYENSLKIAEKFAEEHPGPDAQCDIAIAYQKLGDVNLTQNNLDKAREFYQRAKDVVEELLPNSLNKLKDRRNLAIAYTKLGDVSLKQRDAVNARKSYDRGRAIFADLAADGRDAQGQRDLSISYLKLGEAAQWQGTFGEAALRQGNLDAALKFYENSLQIRQKLAAAGSSNDQSRRDLAVATDRLGDLCLLMNDVDGALKHYQEYETTSQQLADLYPKDNRAKRDLMLSNEKLGDAWAAKSDPAEARRCYEQVRELAEKLAVSDPADTQAQFDLSEAYSRLGDLSVHQGDLAAAKQSFQKDLEVSQRLADAYPRDADAQGGLAVSYYRLGDVSMKENQFEEALASYQKAFEITKRLADDAPKNADTQGELDIAYGKLGDVYVKENKLDEAQKHYQLELGVAKRLADGNPQDANSQDDLSTAYENLGAVCARKRRFDDAREFFGKSLLIRKWLVQVGPKNADYYGLLSWSELLNGNFAGAVDAATRGRALYQENVWIAGNLAHAHLLAGEFGLARGLYEAYKDKQFNGRPFPQMVADDFSVFRAWLLEQPENTQKNKQRQDMEKIEDFLGIKPSPHAPRGTTAK